LAARADLQAPGWLRGKQAIGYRVMPVLGTSGRLWIHMTDDARSGPAEYDLVYAGRTRQLDDLAFRGELETFVASLPAQPRWVDLGTAGATLRDVHGDALTPTPDTPVQVDQRVAGVALVTAYANDNIKDEASARAALTTAGLAPASALANKTDRSWTFEVPAPEGLAAVRATISRANLYAAMASDSVTEKVVRHVGVWKDVTIDPATRQVKLADGTIVPGDAVANLVAFVPPRVPADAELLLVGERPADFWYVLPLYGVLALVLGLMVWATIRGLRSEGPAALPLTIQPPAMPSDPGT
jgi:hypothetical protein